MSTNSSGHGTGIDEIEADIARTRDELADTIDELTARFDVKARARNRIHDLRDRVTDEDGRPAPPVLGAAGVLATVVVLCAAVVIWRRR
jgi:hypothetical protein